MQNSKSSKSMMTILILETRHVEEGIISSIPDEAVGSVQISPKIKNEDGVRRLRDQKPMYQMKWYSLN